MEPEKIEIKLSKKKGIFSFLGAVAFVLTSIWLIKIAGHQERYNPVFVTVMACIGLGFFGLAGLYIYFTNSSTLNRG